jgi:hypothetical protein
MSPSVIMRNKAWSMAARLPKDKKWTLAKSVFWGKFEIAFLMD